MTRKGVIDLQRCIIGLQAI